MIALWPVYFNLPTDFAQLLVWTRRKCLLVFRLYLGPVGLRKSIQVTGLYQIIQLSIRLPDSLR